MQVGAPVPIALLIDEIIKGRFTENRRQALPMVIGVWSSTVFGNFHPLRRPCDNLTTLTMNFMVPTTLASLGIFSCRYRRAILSTDAAIPPTKPKLTKN